jgi:hypothetical protein
MTLRNGFGRSRLGRAFAAPECGLLVAIKTLRPRRRVRDANRLPRRSETKAGVVALLALAHKLREVLEFNL